MNFIVIEDEKYDSLVAKIDSLVTAMAPKVADDDHYLSIEEASQYVGFGKKWLSDRQEQIGYFQDGKDRRFKRADIDAYMAKHRIKRS